MLRNEQSILIYKYIHIDKIIIFENFSIIFRVSIITYNPWL